MISGIRKLIAKILSNMMVSLKRFPEAVLSAAAAAVLAIVINRDRGGYGPETLEILQRAAMICALLFPVSLMAANLFERSRKTGPARAIVPAAVLVFGLIFFFFILPGFDPMHSIKYFAVFFAAFLLFTVSAEWKAGKSFETYVVSLAVRSFITFFYSLVLYGGISAIFLTINLLFSAGIDSRIYLDMLILTAGVFAPAFFLADMPKTDAEFDMSQYSNIIRILLIYIVMPIITIYTVILYIYLIKVVFEGLPDNMIANLILWYSMIGALVTFLAHPFRNTQKWASAFVRFFPAAILPLMAMLFYSISVRISGFGFTESRYFVLAAAVWITAAMIYMGFIKSRNNVLIPLSLAVITLLTVFGPQSAFGISKASQNSRLEKILIDNGMLADGEIIKHPELSRDAQNEITSILMYFDTSHKLDDIHILPDSFSLADTKAVFGFDTYSAGPFPDKNRYFSFVAEQDSLADISGYDYMADLSRSSQSVHAIREKDIEIIFDRDSRSLVINYMDVKAVDIDLSEYIYGLLEDHPSGRGQTVIDQKGMSYVIDGEKILIELRFLRMDGNLDDEGIDYAFIELLVLIDVK